MEPIQFATPAWSRAAASCYGPWWRACLLSALPQEPGCRDQWSKGIDPNCCAASLPSSVACLQAAPGSACSIQDSMPAWANGITPAVVTACVTRIVPFGRDPTGSMKRSGDGGHTTGLRSPMTERGQRLPTRLAPSCRGPKRNRRGWRYETCLLSTSRRRHRCGCRTPPSRFPRPPPSPPPLRRPLLLPLLLRRRARPRRKTTTSSACAPAQAIPIRGYGRPPAVASKSGVAPRPCDSSPSAPCSTPTSACD